MTKANMQLIRTPTLNAIRFNESFPTIRDGTQKNERKNAQNRQPKNGTISIKKPEVLSGHKKKRKKKKKERETEK